jgi:hypothetical protein
MAIQVKHTKSLTKADGIDNTVVQPSDWNATHTMTAAAGKVLGTFSGSTTVGELPITVEPGGQAMLPPTGTTAQRPASPATGMFRYNTTTSFLESYNGTAWSPVDAFPTGTKMLFQQTSAPIGWTKDATHNDKALRVVSGTVSSGGTVDFSSAFASRGFSGSTSSETVTGVVGGTALTNGQLPIHRHAMAANDTVATTPALSASNTVAYRRNTGATDANNYSLTGSTLDASLGISGATGSGETHTHSFSGGAHAHSFSGSIDMAVKYVDLIIATKN